MAIEIKELHNGKVKISGLNSNPNTVYLNPNHTVLPNDTSIIIQDDRGTQKYTFEYADITLKDKNNNTVSILDIEDLCDTLNAHPYFFSVGGNALLSRVENLESNVYRITYYEIINISTSTSGSITIPAGATLKTNAFGASGEAVLSTLDGTGEIEWESPQDGSGNAITATLNSNGNYIASDIYTDNDVALIYQITINAKNRENLNPAFELDFFLLTNNCITVDEWDGTSIIDLSSCTLTTLEVNTFFSDLNTTEITNGVLNIAGSNAAPDQTSGGVDGLTAMYSLMAKGWTITSNYTSVVLTDSMEVDGTNDQVSLAGIGLSELQSYGETISFNFWWEPLVSYTIGVNTIFHARTDGGAILLVRYNGGSFQLYNGSFAVNYPSTIAPELYPAINDKVMFTINSGGRIFVNGVDIGYNAPSTSAWGSSTLQYGTTDIAWQSVAVQYMTNAKFSDFVIKKDNFTEAEILALYANGSGNKTYEPSNMLARYFWDVTGNTQTDYSNNSNDATLTNFGTYTPTTW